MLRLYDYHDSGNGYKVRLLLSQLGLPFDYVETDIIKGETRTPEFLALNPNGRIPVVVLEDGRRSPNPTPSCSTSPKARPSCRPTATRGREVLQWLFFEQYSHEPYVAVARFLLRHTGAMPTASGAPMLAAAPEGRLCGARRDGAASGRDRVLRRRALHDRRHRALCLHACRRRGRVRAQRLFLRPGLARRGSRRSPDM